MTEPSAEVLLAGLARLDNRPETIAAMQRGLDEAWATLDRHATCPRCPICGAHRHGGSCDGNA